METLTATIEAATKFCTGCKVEKEVSEFNKDRRAKNDLASRCKKCKKVWRQSSAGRVSGKVSRKKYQQSDKGKASDKRSGVKRYSTIWGYLGFVYKNIRYRCNEPKADSYKWYGARGIQVKFQSLDEFRNYVINVLKVDPRHLDIDRIDNDGNYEPGNIRFVTHEVNMQNSRCCHV